MKIQAANHPGSHPDRNLACRETVESAMQEILADANTKGWRTIETINAMEEVVKHLRVAYAEDPDPTDATSETDPDPTNDWPAADPVPH
jgi:hypothetical protein